MNMEDSPVNPQQTDLYLFESQHRAVLAVAIVTLGYTWATP